MSIIFNPSGSLDINTDPGDLPESGDGISIQSSALTKAKNVSTRRPGMTVVRAGSAKLNVTAIDSIQHVTAQGGTRYSFAGANIYENETLLDSDVSSGDWTSTQYNAFNDNTQQIFALNGTDRIRITSAGVNLWGIEAPETAPDSLAAGSGGFTGSYSFRYTYVRKVGGAVVCESNPSPISEYVSATSGRLFFQVEAPTDEQVTHIRIYRNVDGDASHYYDQELTFHAEEAFDYFYTYAWEETDEYLTGTGLLFLSTDGATAYCFPFEIDLGTDTGGYIGTGWDGVASFFYMESANADLELGSAVNTDHDRPPQGTVVFGPNYNGTCFILKNNLLYYCLPKQPEYWPALYFIEVSTLQDPLTAGGFFNGQAYVFTKNSIFYIQGTGYPSFFPLDMRARAGAQSAAGVFAVDGQGIYHTGKDGIYLYSGSDAKLTQNTLDPIFRGETVNGLPAVTDMTKTWLIVYRNQLYFGYPGDDDTYPSNVIVLQLDAPKNINYYKFPFEVRSVAIDITNDYLLAGCDDGFIRRLEYGTADDGAAITWEVQSKEFMLPTRAHFPRWIKYDIDVTGTVTGQILLDGESIQSHSITGSRVIKRRLISSENGQRCTINLSGTGLATIYTCEME